MGYLTKNAFLSTGCPRKNALVERGHFLWTHGRVYTYLSINQSYGFMGFQIFLSDLQLSFVDISLLWLPLKVQYVTSFVFYFYNQHQFVFCLCLIFKKELYTLFVILILCIIFINPFLCKIKCKNCTGK